MVFFKKRKRFELEKPKKKVNLNKSTTRFSSKNSVFVGHQVGSGKFAKRFFSPTKANKFSSKLLRENKGLSGKGDERGVVIKPLYLGNRFVERKIKKRK